MIQTEQDATYQFDEGSLWVELRAVLLGRHRSQNCSLELGGRDLSSRETLFDFMAGRSLAPERKPASMRSALCEPSRHLHMIFE